MIIPILPATRSVRICSALPWGSAEPESRVFSSYRIPVFAEMIQVFTQRISGSGY
jgi:hypothetical protein